MKTLTTLLLLLCGLCGFAQTKFVEVHVTDTLWVKIQSFDFHVTVIEPEADYTYADTVMTGDYKLYEKQLLRAKEDERNLKLKELHKVLTKGKFDPKPLQPMPNSYIVQYSHEDPGYIVTIKTPAEALRLREALKGLDYVDASPTNITLGPLDAFEDAFMKKLMAHARRKAGVLAAASGQKLGEALEIYESDTFDIKSIMNADDGEASYNAAQHMMREWTKSLTVKFALE